MFRALHASSYSSCDCCHTSSDYHLLSSLKQKLKDDVDFRDEAEENDSDDDFLDDDDYVSPAQRALMEQVAANALRLRDLGKQGLGAHLDESPEHLLQLISNPQVANIVLHVVDPSAPGSALVDVVLEELARSYPGTHFRRVSRVSLQRHPAEVFKCLWPAQVVAVKGGVVIDPSVDVLSHFFCHHRIGKTCVVIIQ